MPTVTMEMPDVTPVVAGSVVDGSQNPTTWWNYAKAARCPPGPYHGTPIQAPGLAIVDADGSIRVLYRGKKLGDCPSISRIVAGARQLPAGPPQDRRRRHRGRGRLMRVAHAGSAPRPALDRVAASPPPFERTDVDRGFGQEVVLGSAVRWSRTTGRPACRGTPAVASAQTPECKGDARCGAPGGASADRGTPPTSSLRLRRNAQAQSPTA